MPAPTDPDRYVEAVALVGKKVRAAREELGLTQQELSLRADLDLKTVQNVEYGRASTRRADGSYGRGNPKLDTMWALSEALEIGIDYLVDSDQPVRSTR